VLGSSRDRRRKRANKGTNKETCRRKLLVIETSREYVMKIKDIELKLNIKNYKAGKFLHLLALDSIESFERRHPEILPLLLESLKHGDPKKSLKMAKKLEDLLTSFLGKVTELRENIETYMYSELENDEEGKGTSFITPDGNIGFAFEKGKEVVEVAFGKDKEK
jgi:hypothetical protein